MRKIINLLMTHCLFSITIQANDTIWFNIKMSSKISIKKDLKYSISFTNISNEPVLVPSFLLGGMGNWYTYNLFDASGSKIFPLYHIEYLFSKDALFCKPTFLQSGKTIINTDILPAGFFPKPGRYRMVFYWDGWLDGNRNNEPSHFTCERWIVVTK